MHLDQALISSIALNYILRSFSILLGESLTFFWHLYVTEYSLKYF